MAARLLKTAVEHAQQGMSEVHGALQRFVTALEVAEITQDQQYKPQGAARAVGMHPAPPTSGAPDAAYYQADPHAPAETLFGPEATPAFVSRGPYGFTTRKGSGKGKQGKEVVLVWASVGCTRRERVGL